jgi:GTP cyclohydrolase I
VEQKNIDKALALFTEGYEKILSGLKPLGYDVDGDANFEGTAARAAKGLAQLVLDQEEVTSEISAMLKKTFPARYKDMVISKHNVAFGVCPHHLLPVVYRISLAYIPVSKVLGISKLSRLAKLLARAPMLQEDMTHELSRILHEDLDSDGSATYVEGLHMCMASRGAGAHESRVVTSAMRGVFLDQLATREEFINLVTAAHPNLV